MERLDHLVHSSCHQSQRQMANLLGIGWKEFLPEINFSNKRKKKNQYTEWDERVTKHAEQEPWCTFAQGMPDIMDLQKLTEMDVSCANASPWLYDHYNSCIAQFVVSYGHFLKKKCRFLSDEWRFISVTYKNREVKLIFKKKKVKFKI